MKITASLAFVAIISALALQLGSGYSIGGIAREGPQSSVGDPCTAGAGCNEHTECNPYVGQGFCTCADGFHADETFRCVSGAEVVGSICRDGVGCEHLPHSECRSINHKGTCQCSAGFQGDVGSTCTEVPASKVGDECTAGYGCTGNTECSSTDGAGFCTCTHGYHANDTFSCVSENDSASGRGNFGINIGKGSGRGTEVVGSACRNGVGCEYLPNSECSSVNDKGTCQCSAGFHGDDGSTCTEVTASKVGDECTAGYRCTGNTECSSTDGAGFCTCTDGNHADDTFSCVSGTEVVGSACRNGVGCEYLPNSECSSVNDKGTCQCSAGFHGDDGSTCTEVTASKVGDECTAGYRCTGNTECSSTDGAGFCTCTDGNHANDTFSCVSGTEVVGSACRNGVGCEYLPNSECSSVNDKGTCQCSAGFHGDDGSTCTEVTASKVGDECTAGYRCTGNTECSSTDGAGFCTCTDGNHADDTFSCVSGTEVVGSTCRNGVGCEYLPNSECSSINDKGTCQCSAGFHGDDGSTCTEVPASKVGDACTAGYGCTGNTECSSTDGAGFCTCTHGYHADDTFSCVSGDAIIGSVCTHNLGCEKVPGLKCNGTDAQGKCTCNDGFHADGEGRNCVQDVGSPCNPSVGCFDPAAECKVNQMGDYTCQCREGFEAVGNICKKMDSGLHIRVHVEEAKDIDIEIDKF